MTSIISFEEAIKKSKKEKNKQVFELTNTILGGCNRIYDSKLSGALKENELSKEIIAEGKMFSYQILKGEKTELEVEDFEKELPDGKKSYFSFPHEDLDVAKNTITQTNSMALLTVENLNKRSQMPEGYLKGLKKAR